MENGDVGGSGHSGDSLRPSKDELDLKEHRCDSSVAAPGSGADWWEHLKERHRLPRHHTFWCVLGVWSSST